jgi:hypothetical protein
MNKILFNIVSIGLFGIVLSSSVKAEMLEICNSCDSQSSFYVKAIKIASSRADMSYQGFADNITVGSAKSGTVHRWYVSAKWLMQGGDDPDLVIRPSKQIVSAQTQELFRSLADSQLMRQAKAGYDIPASSGLSSAWDIARATGNHHLFDEYVHDNYPITYWSNEFANIIGEFSFSFLVGIEVQLNFDDGTSIRVIMAPINTGDLVLQYVPGSAKHTKSGVSIPDMHNSLEGTYHFSDAVDLQSFLTKLADAGVEFRIVYGGTPSGTVHIGPPQ